jgi:hypothetical protein
MIDTPDTTAYQTRHNGPLKPEIQDFLRKTRDDQQWSYAVLGKQLGISSTFIYNLLNKEARIGTNYLPNVIRHIERLKSGDFQMPNTDEPTDTATDNPMIDHPYNLRGGLQINVRLPGDLTEREAERLALFVRSLAN